MAEAKKKANLKLMPGTSSGPPSYFPFARKGNVLLGIKPWGIMSGARYGVPNTTYFAARLRSAPDEGLFADEDAIKKVVKLQKNPPNLWDAWADVTWEKKSDTHASTTIGVFMRGVFSKDPAETAKLLASISDHKLTKKMADYLCELAGASNLIATPRAISDWLDADYDPLVAKIVASLAKQQEVAEAFESSIGVFGMQSAILKKVFDQTKDGSGAASDKDDPDDQAADDND